MQEKVKQMLHAWLVADVPPTKGELMRLCYPKEEHKFINVDAALPIEWLRANPHINRSLWVMSYMEEDGNRAGKPVHLLEKLFQKYKGQVNIEQ